MESKKEIWKAIKGYEGKYEVSNFGRIKSLNYSNTGRPGISKQYPNAEGYSMVQLFKNGTSKTFLVHRLVAEAFLKNPAGKPYVDHINTIRNDNRAENLRWVTPKENMHNLNTLSKNRERAAKKRYLQREKRNEIGDTIFIYNRYGLFLGDYTSVQEVQENLMLPAEEVFKGLMSYPDEFNGYFYKLVSAGNW